MLFLLGLAFLWIIAVRARQATWWEWLLIATLAIFAIRFFTRALAFYRNGLPPGDFMIYFNAAKNLRIGAPLYDFAAAKDVPMGPVYKYPPLFGILLSPFTVNSPQTVAGGWFLLSLGCLAFSAYGVWSLWIHQSNHDHQPAFQNMIDAIVDGGNSYYRDDIRRAAKVGESGIDYVDCGTSGGVFGLERGYCLMIGGPDGAVERLDPVFASLAPGVEQAERTPGRSGDVSPSENGYLHCGPNGAGHFVKMVHNGIEYGVMAAYAEGLNILKNANAGKVEREADAETAPLEQPEYYQYDLDLPEVAEVWRRGSVIGSWLLDLTAASMQESPDLSDFAGRVSDSGEGRWTSIAAIDEGVPAPVLTTALYERFASRGNDDFADKVLSAMRKQFGGHDEKPS